MRRVVLACMLAFAITMSVTSTCEVVHAQTCTEGGSPDAGLTCDDTGLASDWTMKARKLPFRPLTNASADATTAQTANGGGGLPSVSAPSTPSTPSSSSSAKPFRGSRLGPSRPRPRAGFRIPRTATMGPDGTPPVGNLTRCTIDRVPDLDLDTFNTIYKDKKPVIFGWPYADPNRRDKDARCRWFTKKENIRKNADWRAVMLYSVSGQARYQPKVWTLDRFLDFQDTKPINYSSNAEHQFQIFSHEFAHSWPELRDACSSDLILESLYQQEVDVAEIGVGVKGLGLPWHWHTAVWANKIVHGRKRWYVSLIKDRVPGNVTNPTMMPWQWLTTVYPSMSQEEHEFLAECTVEAGEYIYVPHDLDHQTLNLEPGIFVTYRPLVLPSRASNDDRPLKLDLAKECSRAEEMQDPEMVERACQRATKYYPSETEFRAFAAYAPYVLNHPSTFTLEKFVPLITQGLLSIRANPKGATRATYQLLSMLFTAGQCRDLITIFTHISRHMDRDNTHSHMLFALCIRHLEERRGAGHERGGDGGADGDGSKGEGVGVSSAAAASVSAAWWLDPSNTQSRLDTLLSGQPYVPLYSHMEQPDMYERLPPEWRKRLRQHESDDTPALASALACDAYPSFDEPPLPPPSSSAPVSLVLSPCDEEVEAVANDVQGRPWWQREVASVLLHARALARRDTMSMSVTERFLHMFEVFRGLRLLDRPDLLTGEELAWFTLQTPLFDEQTFKNATSYAERWHMADAVLGEEHVYRSWVERVQSEITHLQNTRLDGINRIHSLLAAAGGGKRGHGGGQVRGDGGAGAPGGFEEGSQGASGWITDNQQQRQFHINANEGGAAAGEWLDGIDSGDEETAAAAAAAAAAMDVVVAAGLRRVELEAAKRALRRPDSSPPSLAGLKKDDGDGGRGVSGDNGGSKGGRRRGRGREQATRRLSHAAAFPFEECEQVGVEEVNARRACAMRLLEGCAYCTELQRCISHAKPNVCPHEVVALSRRGETGACPVE